jgi:hypothetical protein
VLSSPTPPQAAPWCVAMLGDQDRFVLADRETEADALTAAEQIATHFYEAGWSLAWPLEGLCYVWKHVPEGVLISRLEVLPVGEVV